MVKPPLRTKSIGFKVSEEEYAQLETAAQAERSDAGRVVPRGDPRGGASNAAAHDPALAEIVGVRLLLVNVLGPVAAGEKVTPERVQPTAGSNQRSQAPARAGGPGFRISISVGCPVLRGFFFAKGGYHEGLRLRSYATRSRNEITGHPSFSRTSPDSSRK